MKKCSGECKLEKDESEFNKNTSKPDGLQSLCRACSKLNNNQHYKDNPQYYKDKAADVRIEVRAKIRKHRDNSKCVVCGENHGCCLDFHHIDPNTKVFNIAQSADYGWNTVLKEIEKCAVLCANCHMTVHAGIIILENSLKTA